MSPKIALLGCIIFIVCLFILDYRKNAATGYASWVPLL